MRQHLLYIGSQPQIELTKLALKRVNAKELTNDDSLTSCYEITHQLLGKMILQVNLLANLDGVSAYLRQNPVDLLIYDERGEKGIEAFKAISMIKADVSSLAQLWGPDFLFPMSRVVAILEQEDSASRRAFELGRLHVRDVSIAPKNTAAILYWLKKVLDRGIIRTEKIGMALSGGGIEGLLYQIGVIYALDKGIGDHKIYNCNVISGISSGSIAGGMLACDIPIPEVIKSIRKQSDVLPNISSKTIFDLAGTDIAKRIIKESIDWPSLDPSKWLEKTLRSVPTGFFKGEALETYVKESLAAFHKPDSFEHLSKTLLVGATDQDSFEHVVFGSSPWDKIPISEAVRASCALPPVYIPKMINGRWFVDGQVTKTCNLKDLVDRECSLVMIINPLKPHATAIAGTTDQQGGLYSVIQTIKALVSTRFEQELLHVAERYPDIDFMVFEPDETCAKLMAGSPMRYKLRSEVIQYAYTGTLRKLRERYHVYKTKFQKYGWNLLPPEQLKALENEYEIFESPSEDNEIYNKEGAAL